MTVRNVRLASVEDPSTEFSSRRITRPLHGPIIRQTAAMTRGLAAAASMARSVMPLTSRIETVRHGAAKLPTAIAQPRPEPLGIDHVVRTAQHVADWNTATNPDPARDPAAGFIPRGHVDKETVRQLLDAIEARDPAYHALVLARKHRGAIAAIAASGAIMALGIEHIVSWFL